MWRDTGLRYTPNLFQCLFALKWCKHSQKYLSKYFLVKKKQIYLGLGAAMFDIAGGKLVASFAVKGNPDKDINAMKEGENLKQ